MSASGDQIINNGKGSVVVAFVSRISLFSFPSRADFAPSS
jgi:hypothetical protein